MNSLLIDYDRIVKNNNLHLLEKRCQPIPTTHTNMGVVLAIKEKQYNILISLPKGESRVSYINSISFVDNIIDLAWIIYDEEKKLCEFVGVEGNMLTTVLEKTLYNIPNDVTLCVGIGFDHPNKVKMITEYLKLGFRDPYISKKSPLGLQFTEHGVCLLRENNVIDDDSVNDIGHMLVQFYSKEKGYCTLKACLIKDAIKYLQVTSKLGSTINENGVITQKEVAGRLLVKKIDDTFTHHLVIDKTSLFYGKEESVPVIEGLYNFHSHPVEAYERKKTKFAWPSAGDYVGFLKAVVKYDTILHIVTTIEGFYVISLGSYWAKNKFSIDDKIISFIMKEYDFSCKRNGDYSINWYLNKVNALKYQDYQLFMVECIPWEIATKTFVISHRKNGSNNCFTKQKTSDFVKKLLNMEGSKIKLEDI
jgi:hypothetical protein